MRIASIARLALLFLLLSGAASPPHDRIAHAKSLAATGYADLGKSMVQQLADWSNKYWARVAGRDTNLPPRVNGHDEFVADWTGRVLASLHGLHASVVRQSFATPGFRDLPATRPAVNVVVVVPGSQHPDQAVVVGAHPDGEPFSHGSTYDDASGCAIVLALAQTLGETWRAQGPPARTVEFVLFDAEEEGLVGSINYGFLLRHHAVMPKPVFMIDEEQSGVDYPVRPFGLLAQNPLVTYAITNGTLPSRIANLFGPLKAPDPNATTIAKSRIVKARTRAFAQLQAAYRSLPYRGGLASAFSQTDQKYVPIGPTAICCSDNDAFEALGIPDLTLAGNADYFAPNPVPWSYPYDQPEDTPLTLACTTGGSPTPGPALEAALVLPVAMSQSVIQDYAPTVRGIGIAILSTAPSSGHATHFQAIGAQRAAWNFGDGGQSRGNSVSHTYLRPGTYTLSVKDSRGSQKTRIIVSPDQAVFTSPWVVRPPPLKPWSPTALKDIPGCH